ncbi:MULTISPECIES: transglutaminase-like domain-containing protein [Pseudomonadaceae]|uniref:transglutaminase-like domain-containing protein n=1 Tax=Pseudomonadaceae TaxID=135621 RepID=UPI00240E28DC|nr:transglutaminase family protein [Pseudomonas sp. REST10]TNF09213.1 MAG: transglutaminase family protein [Pseudomonadales bacterium]WFC62337.1 transglutaminase family protein [Pseudomonas sp. REST10]|tara:strand:+ start:6405 stop:7067 length:663 start_codon:yes stop_codon:yes gene_type:complete
MQTYLRPGRFIDSDHPRVIEFAERYRGASREPRSQVVALYLAVRDEIRYNPYAFSLDAQTLKASHALLAGESYCVPKAILLAACARHCGIPARIGLADVRNHLSTPRLLELLRSEVFAMHGYTELYLDGRWVKATPAFNEALCRVFKVAPLAFDGTCDSVFHPYNEQGERYMEYLQDHGQFEDLPEQLFFGHLRHCYPHLFEPGAQRPSGDMQREAGVID